MAQCNCPACRGEDVRPLRCYDCGCVLQYTSQIAGFIDSQPLCVDCRDKRDEGGDDD